MKKTQGDKLVNMCEMYRTKVKYLSCCIITLFYPYSASKKNNYSFCNIRCTKDIIGRNGTPPELRFEHMVTKKNEIEQE